MRDLDELLAALKSVVAGRSVVDPGVVERLVEQRVRQGTSPLNALAPRERQVLHDMVEGRTNAAIGAQLHLSESAIEKYVNAIFTKLDLGAAPRVGKRAAAVLAYLRKTPE